MCRYCQRRVPPGSKRRNWCDDGCLKAFNALRNSKGLRAAVWDRDKGVCRTCKLDCTALDEKLRGWRKSSRKRPFARRIREALRLNKPYRKTTWDADHVNPVADGGGSCGLFGVQTLCVWCHRNKTAAQRAARCGIEPQPCEPGKAFVDRVMVPILAEMAGAT